MIFLKKVLGILILLVIQKTNAQLKITSLKYKNKKDFNSFLFPKVADQSSIANKINTYLQTTILETTLNKSGTQKLFDKTRYIPSYSDNSIGQSGYTSMNYVVLLNSADILSLQIDFETMGAYPENYKAYYSFNTRSGKPIKIKDIFIEPGIKKIGLMLREVRKERIDDWLKEMDTLYKNERDWEDSSYVAEEFEKCNSSSDSANISIRKNSILFYKEYCFPHAVRPYDTDLDIVFTYKELYNYLTPFGKRMVQPAVHK